MAQKKKPAKASDILRKRYIKDDARTQRRLKKVRSELSIAEEIYRIRTEAGLTQAQLAKLIGTSQSDVSRLENADYDGHSVKLLWRIAAAVHCRVDIKFVPEKKRAYATG